MMKFKINRISNKITIINKFNPKIIFREEKIDKKT